jgi:hypothetical protein
MKWKAQAVLPPPWLKSDPIAQNVTKGAIDTMPASTSTVVDSTPMTTSLIRDVGCGVSWELFNMALSSEGRTASIRRSEPFQKLLHRDRRTVRMWEVPNSTSMNEM